MQSPRLRNTPAFAVRGAVVGLVVGTVCGTLAERLTMWIPHVFEAMVLVWAGVGLLIGGMLGALSPRAEITLVASLKLLAKAAITGTMLVAFCAACFAVFLMLRQGERAGLVAVIILGGIIGCAFGLVVGMIQIIALIGSPGWRRGVALGAMAAVLVMEGSFLYPRWGVYRRRIAGTRTFHAWASHAMMPMQTIGPGQGFEDLRPFRRLVGTARVLGMGEAVHEVGEFCRMRHRIFEFLVEQMDFEAIAFEAPVPRSYAVNDYVLYGKGTPAQALWAMGMWDLPEVRDLVVWMRQYNADPRHKKKVQFYSFDMENKVHLINYLRAYLRKVHQDVSMKPWAVLSVLEKTTVKPKPAGSPVIRSEAEIDAQLDELLSRFDVHKAVWIQLASMVDWQRARQVAVLLRQGRKHDLLRDSVKGSVFRDQCMVENVDWIRQQLGPQAKIVLWAHNAHLGKGGVVHGGWGKRMGAHLREKLGKDYLMIGSAFNRGQVRAGRYDPVTRHFGRGTPLDLVPAREASLDFCLARLNQPALILDLRLAPRPVRQWFRDGVLTRSLELVYRNEWETWSRIDPAVCYDAVAYVDEIHPGKEGYGTSIQRPTHGSSPSSPSAGQ